METPAIKNTTYRVKDIATNIKSLNAKYLPRLQPDICSGKNSILKDFLKDEKITFDKKTLTTLHFISKYTSHSQSGIAYMKQRTILDQLALEYLPLLSINTLKFVIKKLLKNSFIVTETYRGKKGYRATTRALDLFKEILVDFQDVFPIYTHERFSTNFISLIINNELDEKIIYLESKIEKNSLDKPRSSQATN